MTESSSSSTSGAALVSRRALVALPLAAVMPAARAQFRVEIAGVGATQLPIAVPRFRGEEGAPQPVSAIIRANLERSGFFKLVDTGSTVLDDGAQPSMSEWRGRGADALVAGSVTRLADGRYDVRYRLWDVVQGRDLGGASFAVAAADLRLTAHQISDAIYEKLTGEKGVFSTRIAYVTKAGSRYTLWVADADGEGGQSALGSPEPIISPAWAPDGRELAYVSFELRKPVVYVQDVSTGKRRTLANFRGSNSAPAWAPDGRSLVVTLTREGGSQLYAIGRDGGDARRLSANNGAIDTEAAFTPDAKTIYFVSDRGGSPQIYRMPAAGGAAERVTFSGAYNVSPAISPDGRSMVYIARDGGNFRAQIMDLASGASRLISDTNDDESPSFAPNGRLVMYASRAQGRDVLVTSTLDGRIKARLVVTQADVREPHWGPFGR